MLDSKGFDLWADGYDEAVGLSDGDGSYPFAGYKDVLNGIFKTVMRKKNARVLDVGFGTGTLTSKLYENGCEIFGQDFSQRMLELASEKMPYARLYHGDFTKGLVPKLSEISYDFIIAAYSLHHLTDGEKTVFIRALLDRLDCGGKLLIGDVAFATRAELENCRLDAGDEWDDEEFYFVAEELQKVFPSITFLPVSFCAGILEISGKEE